MSKITILKHTKGAPGLRFAGLGPKLTPCKGLIKLKDFLNKNAFWAENRSSKDLKICLANSDLVVSIWIEHEIVGFGRALTDGIYRAVLWDIVISKNHQGKGYGKIIVNTLIESKQLKNTKKIYLMTTHKKDFYLQLNFEKVHSQELLLQER